MPAKNALVDASALLEEASMAPESAKRFAAAFEPQKDKLRWMLKSTGAFTSLNTYLFYFLFFLLEKQQHIEDDVVFFVVPYMCFFCGPTVRPRVAVHRGLRVAARLLGAVLHHWRRARALLLRVLENQSEFLRKEILPAWHLLF